VGDTCDTTIGCVIQPPLDNCCGNSECEPDIPEFPESPETCPRDCSTSITTNLSSNIANWGFGVSDNGNETVILLVLSWLENQ